MFPLSIGTMGVNIGRKISCKQQEIRNWSIENTLELFTFQYISVYLHCRRRSPVIGPEQLEIIALELGNIVAFDFVYS